MIQVIDLGLIEYDKALNFQRQKWEEVVNGISSETIIYCSHPPVVTKGRATEISDVDGWSGDTFDIERGGRATYHGPGQIIAYPILDLKKRNRDIHKYLRNIEKSVIETLLKFGMSAQSVEGATGVWVKDKKIASIGIAVKKWVSFHGLAICFEKEPGAFSGLNPCGFSTSTMSSIEEYYQENKKESKKPSRDEFKNCLNKYLQKNLLIPLTDQIQTHL